MSQSPHLFFFFPPFFRPLGYPAASRGLLRTISPHPVSRRAQCPRLSLLLAISSPRPRTRRLWLHARLFRIIYNLFLSPLCAIPGPWHYAISDLFLLFHVVRLRQCKRIHELFETYGPVVRVGPNKVVFRDLSTTRNVYSIQKFDKSTYYKSLLTCVLLFSPLALYTYCFRRSIATTTIMRTYMRAYMHLNLKIDRLSSSMTTLDHGTHTIRRKSYAAHYTHNNVAQFQSEMREYTSEVVKVAF
jgi:hypothetical protein